ncbi:ComEC/Rec2 family competence protein [Gemelliphila asaccharolytica]|uniref:ComEC/Rec2-like protein n=1 Tax=Gemelliphila asaccharolytica TaxID=502393 RepID=A0ABR5TNG3_9BACL|nr:ComEC/Rec2 family competence protein [Gemella asaccharolytica]KXB58975.1 ComEC/Rec2-like protein [Gemella asaccharolytica]
MLIFLISLISLISSLLLINIKISFLLSIIFLILIYLNKRYISVKNFLIFFLIFLIFFIRTDFSINNNVSKLKNTDLTEKNIVLVDKIDINGDYLKTIGYINDEKVNINYKLRSKDEKEYFLQKFKGGEILADVEIGDIKKKQNFYSFDYKKYCNQNNIFKNVTIKNIKKISLDVKEYKNKIKAFRLKLIKDIEKNIKLNKKGYFETLIFGEKSNLFFEEKQNFSNLGISHLLAISGLHIATFLSIIYFFCSKLKIREDIYKKIVFISLPLYMLLTGLAPSVLRAGIMILIYILLVDKNIKALDSLLITFSLMLLYNPLYLYNIGFQLSFLVTFSLLMSYEFINSNDKYFLKLLKISLISTLSSLPILIYNFYFFSYMALFSNLIFVPLFTMTLFPVIIVSYISFLLSHFLFNTIFVPILNFIFLIFDNIGFLFNKFLFIIKVGHTSENTILLIFILVIFSMIFFNKRYFKISFINIFIIFFIIFYSANHGENKLEKIKIANNDILYAKNNNTTLLVNTSDNYKDFYNDFRKKENSYDIMNEYNLLYNYEGIKKIDYLILTSEKKKDIGYSKNLIAENMVKKVFVIEKIKNATIIKEIEEIANLNNINVEIIKNNKNYNIKGIILNNNDNSFKVKIQDKEEEISKEY